MKLYAEEQVMNALRLAHSHIKPLQYVVDTLTPIELPSNEETEEEARKQWGNVHRTGMLGFIEGAKWMRDKIQGDNNEQQ